MKVLLDILERIEEQREGIISLAQRLVQFKSINPPGHEGEVSNFLTKELEALGFDVKQIEYSRGRPNIVAVKKGTTSERKLVCYGHLDVVPAGDLSEWSIDPFEGKIVDGELLHVYKKGVSAAELYNSYTSFGEDPFIRPSPRSRRFSAWEYARQRCEEICRNNV